MKKISDERMSELTARFDAWSIDQTRTRGSFWQRDAMKELGITNGPFYRLIEPFLADGRVVNLGHLKGFARTGTSSTVTLADLMEHAASRVDAAFRGKPGRPSASKARIVEQISPPGYDMMCTVANLVAKAVTGHERNWAGVGAQWFGWDPALGDGGAGGWAITAHVERWVLQAAREEDEAAGVAFDPARYRKRVNRYSSALSTLLHLAVGTVLAPTARHSESYSTHFAEWQQHIDRWATRLCFHKKAREGTAKKIRQGLRTLALYATRAGFTDPALTDWEGVRDAIMRDFERGALQRDVMNWARWVYRVMRGHMIQRTADSEWPTSHTKRTSIVSAGAILDATRGHWEEWSAALAGTMPAADEGGYTQPDYGLKGWHTWATVRKGELEIRYGLPERCWPRPTPAEERRIKKRPDLFKLTPKVAQGRLGQFALVAGWLRDTRGTDFDGMDARALVEPANALAFAGWCASRKAARSGLKDDDLDGRSSVGSSVLFSLATLASPYLEAVALKRGELDVADRMRSYSDKLKVMAIDAVAEEGKRIEHIALLWDAGRTGKSTGGWDRLIELRDMLIEAAEREAGMPIAEQIRAIRAGDFRPQAEERWALLIRMAVLITVLRRIPVRVRAACSLVLSMWENVSGNGARERWEGAIRLAFTPATQKSKRAYAPWLIRQEHVGNPHREALLRRDVLELYFMTGGARARVLSIGGQPQKSDHVFPAVASRGGGHGTRQEDRESAGFRWNEESMSAHFQKFVLEYAERLGMDRQALEAEHAATSIHVIRLLFGTKWAKTKLLEASRMLQHANVGVTERKYCAVGAEDVDLEVEAPAVAQPFGSERERQLEQQISEMAKIIADLRAMVEGRAIAA